MDPLQNYGPDPLVTTVVVAHAGDAHLLPRALGSLVGQLPAHQHEVLVMYDGQIDDALNAVLDALPSASFDFHLDVIECPPHSGYYCIARNRAMVYARGLYIAGLDADNEFGEGHLRGLLRAIRNPDGENGYPHFVYARRFYVRDEGAPEGSPEGASPLVRWNPANIDAMAQNPLANFVDTGDMLISKSALYWVAERTSFIWNPEVRRFGDWDLLVRMVGCGMRGLAVDQATNIYHWTGKNLQMTRPVRDDQLIMLPEDVYESMKAEGKIR